MKIPKQAWVLLGIAAVIIVGAVFLLKSETPASNKTVASTSPSFWNDHSHMTGNKSAKVTLVEFGDYQCPACGAALPILKQVLASYKDNPNFNFVFRQFPLSIHANAQIAAEAAEAAGAQGKFWEMHDKIYENQNQWSAEKDPLNIFADYAQQIGLDVEQFKADVQSKKFQDIINADENDGISLNVNATPTFFINGEKQQGVPNFNAFKQLIDSKLTQ